MQTGAAAQHDERYSRPMVFIHWLIACVAIFHLLNAFVLHYLEHSAIAQVSMDLHRSVGLTLLILTIARLGMRLTTTVPELKNGIPVWQRLIAKSVHMAFYVVLLAAPLVGWAYSNSTGIDVSYFWIIPLPTIAPVSLDFAANLRLLHILLAVAFCGLLGLHTGAAFYNKLMRKNGVYEKMLWTNDTGRVTARVSIWIKMAAGSTAVLMLSVFVGYVGRDGAKQMSDAGLAFYDGLFQSASYARSAQVNFERSAALLKSAQGAADLTEASEIVDAAIADLEISVERTTEKATAEQITATMGRLKAIEAALSAQTLPSADAIALIAEDLEYIVQDIAAHGFLARSAFEERSYRTSDIIALTIVITCCLAVAVSVLTAGTISRQIHHAVSFAKRLSAGNYDEEIEVRGKAEVAQLLHALEEMRASIVGQIAQNSEHLGREQEEKSRHEQRLLSLKEAVETFRSETLSVFQDIEMATGDLEQQSKQLASVATTAKSQTEQNAEASRQSVTGAESVASASSQLASSFTEVAAKVVDASQFSMKVDDQAQEAVKKMAHLNAVALDIQSFTGLIQDIASQTNLLALNATIEAARAGDMGRGFGVVANEVKTLALQTAKATEEIEKKVKMLSEGVDAVSLVLSDVGGIATEMKHISATISAAVEQQQASTSEISYSVQSSSDSIRQLSDSVESAMRGADDTFEVSSNIAMTSQLLERGVKTLVTASDRFIDEVTAA